MRATESYHTACPRAVASLQQSALFSASSLIGPCAHIITVRIDTPAGMGIRGTGDQDNSRGRLSHRGDLSFKSLRVHHNCRICKPLTRGAPWPKTITATLVEKTPTAAPHWSRSASWLEFENRGLRALGPDQLRAGRYALVDLLSAASQARLCAAAARRRTLDRVTQR